MHPGLVLGRGAESEVAAAIVALETKAEPEDWTIPADDPITTVLATGTDRRIVLLEGGIELAAATVESMAKSRSASTSSCCRVRWRVGSPGSG